MLFSVQHPSTSEPSSSSSSSHPRNQICFALSSSVSAHREVEERVKYKFKTFHLLDFRSFSFQCPHFSYSKRFCWPPHQSDLERSTGINRIQSNDKRKEVKNVHKAKNFRKFPSYHRNSTRSRLVKEVFLRFRHMKKKSERQANLHKFERNSNSEFHREIWLLSSFSLFMLMCAERQILSLTRHSTHIFSCH